MRLARSDGHRRAMIVVAGGVALFSGCAREQGVSDGPEAATMDTALVEPVLTDTAAIDSVFVPVVVTLGADCRPDNDSVEVAAGGRIAFHNEASRHRYLEFLTAFAGKRADRIRVNPGVGSPNRVRAAAGVYPYVVTGGCPQLMDDDLTDPPKIIITGGRID